MPYSIEIASVHGQLNKAIYEFNLIDSDNILPNTRRSYEVSCDISSEEMDLLKTKIIQEETDKALEVIEYENNKNFMRQFIPLVESSLETLRLQLLNQVLSENQLNDGQIDIANKVEFTWKLKGD